ncbi:hypothetical protein MSG28_006335 [Choristoneura fumiferana]|uniref:Uncharacterized protein n=1 Tax=Choristoneura fumiferana TaxID=7141 RepID=A0ACC0JEF5_CHOFU|nr:hypothetical protein MSG28_006335 [Choristoneura fumiferana]
MTALSIERFVAVYYPLSLKSTPVSRRTLRVMVMMLLVAMLETVPEMLTVDLITTRHSSVCFTLPTRFARTLNGVLALLTFFVPLIIMIAAYSMIMLKVNTKQQKNFRNNTFNYKSPRGRVNMLINEKIIRETKILGQELAREEIFLHVCAAMETIFTEQSREEIKQIEQLYALIQEEARLKRQLEELGIHVPPPNDP